MTGYSSCKCMLLAVSACFIVACQSGEHSSPQQSLVEWPRQQLLFVADTRNGQVRSFFLGNGTPTPFAQTHDPQRGGVRDLQLDAGRGQLWVLGDNGISIHKARGLILLKSIALDTRRVVALSLEDDQVWLIDAAGERVGQIDRGTLVAQWRIPDHHG